VHLSSVHQAGDVRIFRKECRTLAAAGYRVALVAQGEVPSDAGAVRVVSMKSPTSRGERMTITAWRVLRHALALKASLYHVHDAELIPVGMVLKLLNKRVVYDVHENLPADIRDKPWIPEILKPLAASLAAAVEWAAVHLFDRIVVADPGTAARFPPARTVVIQNFVEPGELISIPNRPHADRPPNFVYVGGITILRGVTEMMDAIGCVKTPGATLTLVGRFSPDNLRDQMQLRPGWERVRHLGWQSRRQVAVALGEARAGLVVLHRVQNFLEAQPIKLFEYMSAGLPVIASDFPNWRRIIAEHDCGILVDPMDPSAIATAMDWMVEHPVEAEAMGQRGQQASQRYYVWATEGDRLVALYSQLIGPAKCAG